MEITKGDLVTRTSYNNDMVFKVVNIKNGIFYLKGVEERLYADSPLEDLNIYNPDENKEEEFDVELKPKASDRADDYFYLPAKILHIDTDNQLSNKPTNPYKIRENSKFNNHKKSQKEQKISNFS